MYTSSESDPALQREMPVRMRPLQFLARKPDSFAAGEAPPMTSCMTMSQNKSASDFRNEQEDGMLAGGMVSRSRRSAEHSCQSFQARIFLPLARYRFRGEEGFRRSHKSSVCCWCILPRLPQGLRRLHGNDMIILAFNFTASPRAGHVDH